jgi:phosphate transport system permease protein
MSHRVVPKSVLIRRKLFNIVFLTLTWITVFIGLAILFWILGYLAYKGIQGINLELFTKFGGDPNGGGLLHAFIGHAIISALTIIIGVPLGILIGIYITEFARYSKFGSFISDVSDIMPVSYTHLTLPTIA